MATEAEETRKRILESAAAVFAERGFAATTVRMICGRAQVNVSAVNYHFGGKEALYLEVLRHVRRRAFEKYPPTYGLGPNPSAEEKLHAFIHSFLLRVFGDDGNLGYGTLTMREMVEPSRALDMIVDEGVHELFEQLVEIVRLLMDDDVETPLLLSCARSIIGQCVFYHSSKWVLTKVDPNRTFDREDIARIADEIVTFSLSALRGLCAGNR